MGGVAGQRRRRRRRRASAKLGCPPVAGQCNVRIRYANNASDAAAPSSRAHTHGHRPVSGARARHRSAARDETAREKKKCLTIFFVRRQYVQPFNNPVIVTVGVAIDTKRIPRRRIRSVELFLFFSVKPFDRSVYSRGKKEKNVFGKRSRWTVRGLRKIASGFPRAAAEDYKTSRTFAGGSRGKDYYGREKFSKKTTFFFASKNLEFFFISNLTTI